MATLTPRQIGEIHSREFLGEETWKRWKAHFDECMSYRKTIKGKPTDDQRILLQANSDAVRLYSGVLFHSAQLAKHGRCVCGGCIRDKASDPQT